ncbi:MAG: NAD-dependent epimerase/dehydratase family protein [Lachnospirales bacterium]
MKILITGKNSYIGNNILNFLKSRGHDVETVSLRNGIDSINLDGIDCVIHCAAIVHHKEKKYAREYAKINYYLTQSLAKKAKESGVKQFVFMSTMSVYDRKHKVISKYTPLNPNTLYGKSKLMAERSIGKLNDDNFKITILRPPMVYGKGCPGNYGKLSALAKKLPVFPDTQNKKSVLYVGNLSFFVASLVENNIGGLFMPMDEKYVSTAEIAKNINKNIKLSTALGNLLKLLNFKVIKKAFTSLYYDDECATKIEYVPFEKGIEYSEKP